MTVSGGILTSGGGRVFESGAVNQIGAKGTIDSNVLPKQYLSQELSDPSIKDIKVGDTESLKDYGIGEYIYGIYAKNVSTIDWANTTTFPTIKKASAYNIAMVVSDEQK
jgi:hypothetical protein